MVHCPSREAIAHEATRACANWNWQVFPVRDKKPVCKWRPLQAKRIARWAVACLFRRPCNGLAVIPGAVSFGLAIRDFDTVPGYDAWAAEHPALADVLPTARTGRGFQVFCRLRREVYHKLGDGELIGDSRHYVVLPPSWHPIACRRYAWVQPLIPLGAAGSNLPILDLHKAGFDRTWDTECRAPRGVTHRHRIKNTVPFPALTESIVTSSAHNIPFIIAQCIPTGPGQRNTCLFILARKLKAVAELVEASEEELLPIVRAWHERALPAIRTKPFEASWSDFCRQWGLVQHPANSAVEVAAALAGHQVWPESSRYVDPRLRFLASICWHLQRYTGEESFFVSTRDAAAVLGLTGSSAPMRAWRLLKRLERDLIRCVRRGVPKPGGRATEYLWIGS
jgi:hypothetical protein